MNALEYIKDYGVEIGDIKRVEFDGFYLNIQATWDLLGKTEVEDMLADINIYTKQGIFKTYEEDTGLTAMFYIPNPQFKRLVEIVPISLTDTWWDEEYRRSLPHKSEKLIKKEKEQDERKYQQKLAYEKRRLSVLEEEYEKIFGYKEILEPFTVFSGGRYDNCYYVTLPKTATINSGYDFNMFDGKFRDLFDWAGYAYIDDSGSLSVWARFVKLETYFNDFQKNEFPKEVSAAKKALHEALSHGLKTGKLSYTIGVSPEQYDTWISKNPSFQDVPLKEAISKVVKELKEIF